MPHPWIDKRLGSGTPRRNSLNFSLNIDGKATKDRFFRLVVQYTLSHRTGIKEHFLQSHQRNTSSTEEAW